MDREQELRDKVVKGLECCGYSRFMDKCQECPYDGKDCFKRLKTDALELLKAQEPRVMTLEEALNVDCAYIEIRIHKDLDTPCCILTFDEDGDIYPLKRGFSGILDAESYGTNWRCWTSRPTDKQREATSW